MNCRLLIFAKNPVEGKVKTRLARTVGNKEAVRIYKKLIEHTLNVAVLAGTDTEIWLKDESADSMFKTYPFDIRIQQGQDLGERMMNAVEDSLLRYPNKAVLIIGSDCPMIDEKLLRKACESLNKSDVVIGPATDGGYYLIGMNKVIKDLFLNKTWSHDQVLDEALSVLRKQEIGYQLLSKLSDIDTEKDWNKFKHLIGE